MSKKTVTVTLRVPPEIHQKLKVISALKNVSMTDIIVDVVDRMKVKTPGFMEPGSQKPVVPTGRVSTEEEIRPIIMRLHAEGKSLQGICDALIAQGLPTVSGKGGWKKGSVTRMIQRWESDAG
jgi:hypothetical protein